MAVRAQPVCRMIFHADDFGMNVAVNRGILLAFRDGLLTSTSLLANAPAAEEACQAWPTLIADQASGALNSSLQRRELDDPSLAFDLGIHLNLTQGRPLTADRFPSELLDGEGNFPGIGRLFYRLNRSKSETVARVSAELQAQIEWMCDRGRKPTHLNGHQYIEMIPQIAALIPELVRRYAIPVVRVAFESGLTRNLLLRGRISDWGLGLVKQYYASRFRRCMRAINIGFPDRFFGTSHAGLVDQQTLLSFLRQSFTVDYIEIGLHPGEASPVDEATTGQPWFDPLARLRPTEREWLCGSQLAAFLKSRYLSLGRLQSIAEAT